jgi:tripartite-type tricarboxylate transporter receptor subunit TctC
MAGQVSASAQAAPYPTKSITMIVPFPPGGLADIVARPVAEAMSRELGQPVIIENKGGAGGSVGSEIAARAPADGYNLLGGTISSHAINVSLYPKLGYDPIKSFTPVYLYGTNPVVLVVAANSPYKTLRDLLTAAKANPGKLSGASAGNGTSQHLAQELLAFKGDVKFTHVPYKGSAPAIQDVMSGQVDFMFDTTVVAGAHIQSGKLRALAVTSGKRLTDTLTEVPTVSESGWPGTAGFEVVSWQALFAPAGTPKPIVDKLHAEILKIIQSPEMQERIKGLGMQPSVLTPEQVQAFQKAEIEKWAQVIKAANIKLD